MLQLSAGLAAAEEDAKQAVRAKQEAVEAREDAEAQMQTLQDDLHNVREQLEEERERPSRGKFTRGPVRAAPRQAEHDDGAASGASAGGMQDELFEAKERIAAL